MKDCIQLLKVYDIRTPDMKIPALFGPWWSAGFTYICPFSFQADFQISEEEKERLSAELQRLQSLACNMDDMMRKSQELCSRLSQQESGQNENLKVGGNDKDGTFHGLPSVKCSPRCALRRGVKPSPPSWRTHRRSWRPRRRNPKTLRGVLNSWRKSWSRSRRSWLMSCHRTRRPSRKVANKRYMAGYLLL